MNEVHWPPVANVRRGDGAKSISARSRRVVYLGVAVLIVICLAAIGSMRAQSNEVNYLTLLVGPTEEINSAIYRDMTEAQGALLRYQLSGDLRILVPYRAARVRVLSALAPLHSKIELLRKHYDENLKSSVAQLEANQQSSIMKWMAQALVSERVVLNGEVPHYSLSARLFEDFRQANSDLNKSLTLERAQARYRARDASQRGIVVVIAAAVLALVIMLLFGLQLARSISRPIIALSHAINRQREGDLTARAQENRGSLETRGLARNFNLLVEHESELEQVRALALRMHEITVKIGHAIRIAPSTQQALEILCSGLGEGIGVDRVMANTMNVEHEVIQSSQWFKPGLPPLGKPPIDLIPHVKMLVKDLWKSSSHLVSNDRLAPEMQSEHDKIFYRETNAYASIIVPIGLGDQEIGMIYVVTIDRPRVWADSEIQAVERVAAFLAQFIVEQTYRDQQNEHVERLEQHNVQKSNFVATVSHELRTPLTSIIGYLEVMRDGYAGELTGVQTQILDMLDRNASRLLNLIKDLLMINQGERGGGTSKYTDVSMRAVIADAVVEVSSMANRASVQLKIDASTDAAIVRGDVEQLKSVVINAISNAIKFSHEGGVVAISCTLDTDRHIVQFICQDNGIGIPESDQSELFTRFFRATNAASLFIPGTGLGLSIVKQIVDQHDGKVKLSSVEGEGTTVIVELPLSTTSSSGQQDS